MSWTTFISEKGGVGRTTLALNLGYALAARGKRVLILEVDPQGGLGHSLGPKVARAPGLSELLTGTCSTEQVLMPTKLPTLSLLPWGAKDYRTSQQAVEALADGSFLQQLKTSLAPHFDTVLIDPPAGLLGPSLGALIATDSVLSPLRASALCLRSVESLLEGLSHILQHHRNNTPFQWQKFVINMWSPSNAHSINTVQEIYRLFPTGSVMQTSIPTQEIAEAAAAAATPVALYSRHMNPLNSALQELTSELEMLWTPDAQEQDYAPISLVD